MTLISKEDLVPTTLHNKLLEVIQLSKQSFVAMGALLYELYNEERYLDAVGAGIDSWEDYLKQPEVGLTPKEANRLMQIYEVFVLQYGYPEDVLADISVKNMHYLLPVVKKFDGTHAEEVDALVQDAAHLTQTDFRERIYDVKTEETGERTYVYLVMQRCVETGTLKRVPGIDSDEILEVFKDRIDE